MKQSAPYFRLWLLSLCIYLSIAISGRDLNPTLTPYYNYLADAFLHGQTNLRIVPEYNLDLSYNNNKWYLYWGPIPALIISPLIYLFGTNVSDVIYTGVIASFAIPCILAILLLLSKLKYLKITTENAYWLAILFGFGTLFLVMATSGNIWHASIAFGVVFLALSLIFLLSYKVRSKAGYLIIASVFWNFAVLSRFTLFLNLPIFLYLLLNNQVNKLKSLVVFFAIGFIFLIPTLIYNYVRFNSPFDTGYSYYNGHPRFTTVAKLHGGYWNIIYAPKNFYYLFLATPISVAKNKISLFVDKEGMAIWFTTPALLLLLLPDKFNSGKINPTFKRVLYPQIAISLVPILTVLGTGWEQYGYRYSLDFMLWPIVLLAEKFNHKLTLHKTLFALSIIMCSYGVYWTFNNLH